MRLNPFLLVVLLAFLMFTLSADAAALGGSLSGSGQQSVTNACNGEVVSGIVTFSVFVKRAAMVAAPGPSRVSF